MKMIFAGVKNTPTDTVESSESFRFNCTRNKNCQKEFYIPVHGLCDFMLFFDLPFMPVTYSIFVFDSCTGAKTSALVVNYVIGSSPGGFYGVFGGLLTATPLPVFFNLQISFFDVSGKEAVFYSHDFEVVTCEPITKVSGCYNDPTIGTEAVDNNGVYYGFPLPGAFLGDHTYRYYHFIYLRKASVIGQKTRLNLTAFNSKRIYKTSTTKDFIFQSELVPEFFKDEIVAVIARGNILIGSKNYRLAEDVDLSASDLDNKLWIMDVPLTEVIKTYFSCKLTECNFDPCVPNPVEVCCEPTDVVADASVECGDPTELSFTYNDFCSDNGCSQQGTIGIEFNFTSPTPFEIRLLMGFVDNPFSGARIWGYNLLGGVPSGLTGETYTNSGFRGVPYELIIPAGVTYFMYWGESYIYSGSTLYSIFQEGTGFAPQTPFLNGTICQSCQFPISKFIFKAKTQCVVLNSISHVGGKETQIII